MYMRFVILFIVLLPMISYAKISFAFAACRDNDNFVFHNAALFRQAMIKANGKDWFLRNIVCNNPKSLVFRLNIIAGDYCIATGIDQFSPPLTDDFYNGVKNALKILSANNDTLYIFGNPLEKQYIPGEGLNGFIVIRGTFPETFNISPLYNYDNFDISSKQGVDFFKIHICLNYYNGFNFEYLPNNFFSQKIKKLIKCFQNCSIINARDAELIFNAIIKYDKFILSLPLPEKERIKKLPWSYTPDLHKKKNIINLEDL